MEAVFNSQGFAIRLQDSRYKLQIVAVGAGLANRSAVDAASDSLSAESFL